MILKSEKTVKFFGIENRTSKTNNAFQLVTLADMETVEKFSFFKRDELKLDGIMNGADVIATFEMSVNGYNNQMNLIDLKVIKN